FEPYLNGIANSLKLAKDSSVTNIVLWPDDVDLIFHKLPDDSLSAIFILFPDPWPKSRHQKRRIVNPERLKIFAKKLKPDGIINFASDIANYFDYAQEVINASGIFKEEHNSTSPYSGYVKTRYHLKAEEAGRIPQFLRARKEA
ncbi:MAG: protein-(glutamine-N5) methyltransferase, release factor-specific, partial [Rickettsiaceae bacterium]|nr:protein-(glutamine-N5) methyltransferase, release factor-specific [Rickettsiaceae bacterium]